MINRILIALLGIPALMFIYYSGGIYLLALTNIIVGIGLFEFYRMSEAIGIKPYKNIGLVAGVLLPNIIYFKGIETGVGALIIFLILILGIRVINNQVENTSKDIGTTLLGVVYISLMFSHILLFQNLENGWKWLIATQIMVWLCDSAAYFVGMATGRKFFKEGFSAISPKKSKEGAIGGIVFTIIGILLINRFFNLSDNILAIVILGFFVSLVAQIGDLAESMFKREFKIKDSSRILGEHGGILDRFDSMIFVIPMAYYILKIFVYFVGMATGRKFFKEGFSAISPKKSKEGAIGGIVFTIIGILLINRFFNLSDNNFAIVILGFFVSLVAQIGDLAESMFKREFKIKDSSRILGEHGGILDRFDSMIFVIPMAYYILKIFVD